MKLQCFSLAEKNLEVTQESLDNLILVIISQLVVYIGEQRLPGNLSGTFYNYESSQCLKSFLHPVRQLRISYGAVSWINSLDQRDAR